MGQDTTEYIIEMKVKTDSVTLSRNARDLIVSHKKWQILDYMEGHYVQAKRRTGVTNWSILLSIRLDSVDGVIKATVFGETYGKGPLIRSGLQDKITKEIVEPLQNSFSIESSG